jgi:hypothetical protein
MRHYVLTRAAYGPSWTLDANRRRLDVTRAVTARLMAAQTTRNWAWVVLLDPRDRLLDERRAVFTAASPRCLPIEWVPPPNPKAAPWDRHAGRTDTVQRIAAEAYRAPWGEAIGERDTRILQTRLDDDDGLAPDALARYQAAAVGTSKRTILMLPEGVRIWRGRFSTVRHERNAMHTLVTQPGDDQSVYAYGHAKPQRSGARIVMVDESWGWLWVRHQDTISGWRRAEKPINHRVRAAFPVDWAALDAAWKGAQP